MNSTIKTVPKVVEELNPPKMRTVTQKREVLDIQKQD